MDGLMKRHIEIRNEFLKKTGFEQYEYGVSKNVNGEILWVLYERIPNRVRRKVVVKYQSLYMLDDYVCKIIGISNYTMMHIVKRELNQMLYGLRYRK